MNAANIRQTPIFFMAVQNGAQHFGATGLQQQSSAMQQFAQFVQANVSRLTSAFGGFGNMPTRAGFPPPQPSPFGRSALPQ
jgi:hypothetical protein